MKMMKESMAEEFLKTYQRGSHCASTALMNVCRYLGLDVSEDYCFGVGQGLGFSFYKDENMDMYSFSGRNRDIVRYFFDNIGAEVFNGYSMDEEELWGTLTFFIKERRVPVIVKLDMDSMDYLKERFKYVRKIQQSEHLAVLIDIMDGEAVVSEYFDKKPIMISKEALLKGMGEAFEEKACNNVFYAVTMTSKYIDYDKAAVIALKNNCTVFQNGFGSNMGLPGLKNFEKNIIMWKQNKAEDFFCEMLRMSYFSFEKIGTGGGNFRRIYGRFVGELAKKTGNSVLADISERYLNLANDWKDYSALALKYCDGGDDRESIWAEIKNKLELIIQKEESASSLIGGC